MDWIKKFCQLPVDPGAHLTESSLAVFLPTRIPLKNTSYLRARLGQNLILLRPGPWRRDLAGPFERLPGHCWVARIPELAWCGERGEDDLSPLWLLEDGLPLGSALADHQELAELGSGRFSHWGGNLFFSTSDNTDPNTNGRVYQVSWEAPPDELGLESEPKQETETDGYGTGELREHEWGFGLKGEIKLGPEAIAALETTRPEEALDLSPYGGMVWPNRAYLRRLGLMRLHFRQGLEWRMVGLEDSARTRARTLNGQAALAMGRTLIKVFGQGRGAGAARRFTALGSVKVCRAPVEGPGERRHEDRAKLFEKELAREKAEETAGRVPEGRPLEIVHYIGGLGPGGGERSLVLLARAARAHGHRVKVLTTHEPSGNAGYYNDILEDLGILVARAGSTVSGEILTKAALSPDLRRGLLSGLPVEFRKEIAALLGELLLRPPDILFCWMDHPNIIGGLAGFLGRVPRVVFSVQSQNPTHFPRFNKPWLWTWYRFLSQCRGLRLTAICRACAEDYDHWLGLERSQFRAIPTGLNLDSIVPPTREEQEAFRNGLGIDRETFVVAGVFRLFPEKRISVFLRVIKGVVDQGIEIKSVIAGDGPLSGELDSEIRRLGLEETVIPLGLRKDVYKVMGSCDALLLCSETEGLPHVLLEAQALGLPVVATDVGGNPETMLRDRTGFLHPKDDVQGMVQSLARLAQDQTLARNMGREGREFVEREFSLDRMYNQTMDLISEE